MRSAGGLSPAWVSPARVLNPDGVNCPEWQRTNRENGQTEKSREDDMIIELRRL